MGRGHVAVHQCLGAATPVSLTRAPQCHLSPEVWRSVSCGDLECYHLCRTTVLFREGQDVTEKLR